MGRFVNPDNSAFQVALNSKIHIDVQWLKKIGWLNTNDTELNRARQDVEALKQLKTEIENLIKNIRLFHHYIKILKERKMYLVKN